MSILDPDADLSRYSRMTIEQGRIERLARQRIGKATVNGLQAHMYEAHGYVLTRLLGFAVIDLVRRHASDHRGKFIHEVHDRS